jgi:acyl-coenzyme A thioesterase PaaI-like protein
MVLETTFQDGMHQIQDFLNGTPVPQSDLDFFKSVQHLQHYFSNPAYTPAPFYSLYTKPNNPTSDLYFAKTIRSDDTIPHTLLFLKTGDWSIPEGSPPNTKSRPFPAPDIPDVTILFDLQPGMNGFAHTAHGGAMCSLLDETLGMCAEVHRQKQFAGQRTNLYTAQLNTSFLAPVVTPGVVRIKAWLVGAEGRKWMLRAQMDDAKGKVLLETESLWISVREEGSL